ncbi:hypothetical protein GCM10025859_07960 [Alicyclobacillus fastidiosus]|nr:hypothetical protein GCM10025859_07960 [Alicyclobacillus fastidiosus]
MSNTKAMAEKLAEYVCDLRFVDLPERVVETTKVAFLDWLGNAVVGSQMPPAQIVSRVLAAQGVQEQQATIIGSLGLEKPLKIVGDRRLRATALWATLVNGSSSHIIELDDVHKASIIHAGTVVIPASLALAEHLHSSGRELIEAIVVGFDTCIRIGEAVTPAHYQYFHTTGTVGTFGAAAAAAKLLKLSVDETCHALGTAGTQAAGLWEFIETGAMSKHLHSGKAGYNGLLAAMLAKEGFTGALEILEGKRGFMNAMASSFDESKVLDRLGTRFTVLENCYKIHSSCRHTHHAIDLVIQLVSEHDLDPEEIQRIEVGTYQVALDITDNPNPTSVYDGKFSIQYCTALAAVKRRAGLDEFIEENLNDDIVRDILGKVRVFVDTDANERYPEKWGQGLQFSQ